MTSTPRSATGHSVPTWVYLTALAAVTLVSRLPQLLSPNLLLEGDECILGLMAMHLAGGHEFPVFFYGQKYGLSIVEAPAAALNFVIFGVGALPLKLAMLGIWIVGILFYFLAFSSVLGATRSFWITLVLILMPAWAASSMKALSGYITAFSATAVAFYLITRNDNLRSTPWLFAGGVSAIIYFSQPLWLPGLLPIVLFFLFSSRRLSFWFFYLSGIVGVILAITLIKASWLAGAVESWTAPGAGNPHLLGSFPRLLNQTYVNLTGSYSVGFAVHPGPVTAIVAYLWLAMLAVVVLLQIYRLVTRKYLLWSHLLFASVLLTLLANWVLLDRRDARYMLALNVPLVFMTGVELFDLADRYRLSTRRCVSAIVLVLALEAVSMNEFAQLTYMWWTNPSSGPSEARTMEKVIDNMRARGVTRAFAMNPLLQWQITFYSRESVIVRWKDNIDRYPAYISEVDRALEHGETVAVVGYVRYTGGLERMVPDPRSIIDVDGKYFVYIGAEKELLRKAGFRFSK
ncbi:MAG: hypothetical protein DMF84_27450 [Acidobacteria bacterium]|nr:MAG: hypothetical protein DMF84_27450 [Acidobacteriota bacterium]